MSAVSFWTLPLTRLLLQQTLRGSPDPVPGAPARGKELADKAVGARKPRGVAWTVGRRET